VGDAAKSIAGAEEEKDDAEAQRSQRFAEKLWTDGSGVHGAFTWA